MRATKTWNITDRYQGQQVSLSYPQFTRKLMINKRFMKQIIPQLQILLKLPISINPDHFYQYRTSSTQLLNIFKCLSKISSLQVETWGLPGLKIDIFIAQFWMSNKNICPQIWSHVIINERSSEFRILSFFVLLVLLLFRWNNEETFTFFTYNSSHLETS